MYEKILKKYDVEEVKVLTKEDLSFFNSFDYEVDNDAMNDNYSLFGNQYASFGSAVKRNDYSGVVAAVTNAVMAVGGNSGMGLIIDPYSHEVISEAFTYLIFKAKNMLLNRPDNSPFVDDRHFFTSVDNTFFITDNLLSGAKNIASCIDLIDIKKCEIRSKRFILEYLDRLGMKLQSESDLIKCGELISNVYCGLYTADRLMNYTGFVFKGMDNINQLNSTKIKCALHCASTPLNLFFSFPDCFNIERFNKPIADCLTLFTKFCEIGFKKNLISYEYCSNIINPILNRINAIINLNLGQKINKKYNDLRDIFLKWSA